MRTFFTLIFTTLFAVGVFAQDFSFNYTGPIPSDWDCEYYYVPVADMATATGFESDTEFLTWYDGLPDVVDGDKEFMCLVTDEGDTYAYSNWGSGFWLLDNGYHCGWYETGDPTWTIACYGLTEERDYVVFYTGVNGYLTYSGGEHMEGTVAVNGKKRATLFFSVDLLADAQPEISKMEKVGNDITYTFEQYPTNKESLKYYNVPLLTDEIRSGILDLGLDFNEDNIANHVYIRQYDQDGMMSDFLSFVRGEATLGPVYDDVTGNPTEALCLGGGGEDKAIVGGFSFVDNVLAFGFGQKANVLKVGDHHTLEVYIVNEETNQYALLNLELNVVESAIHHETEIAKMRKVGEETMTYTRGINDGWDYVTYHDVDIAAVAALFGEGISIGDLAFKILDPTNQYFIDDYTCNTDEIGFWMTMDSHNNGYAWGEPLYYVFSRDLPEGWLTIGHMPEIFVGGEKTSGSVFLTYADMYYEFHSDITIGEEAAAGIVGETDVTIIADPNEDFFVLEIPNLDEVTAALGCTEAQILNGTVSVAARMNLVDEEFTEEGYCEDDCGYAFTSDGAWVNPESETFFDDVDFFLGIEGTQFIASLMVNLKPMQTYNADIALAYNNKYYVFHASVCTEETGIEKVNDSRTSAFNAQSFNLAGQRVSADYKGIVITNGKKYLK